MTIGYLRSASTRHNDAEDATDRGTAAVQETTALPLRDLRPPGRGNSRARQSSIHAMQRTHGNRAVQRYVQGSNSPRLGASLPIQRAEGGMWDYAKKLIGVDQIGPGIENIVGKAKSGYNSAEKTVLDWLKPGGNSAAPGSEVVPGGEYGPRPDYSDSMEIMSWSWGATNPGSFAGDEGGW